MKHPPDPLRFESRQALRAWLEAVLHRVPLLGTARRYLALSRLAAALEGPRHRA